MLLTAVLSRSTVGQGLLFQRVKSDNFFKNITGNKHRSLIRSSISAPTTATDTNLDTLVEWLSSEGVLSEKANCRIVQSGNSLQVVTSRSVSAKESIATIPESLWITAETVRKSNIGPYVSGLDLWLQISLFLLAEVFNAESRWKPYLESLPRVPDVPLFWPEEELQELEGTQVLASVVGYRQFFEQTYAELEEAVFGAAPGVFPQPAFSYRNFLWAAATVRSRSHTPLEGDNLALVPLADLVQHKRGAGSWKLQTGMFKTAQSVVLEAGRPYDEGEPFAIDFGPQRLDSQILLDYGVVDPSRSMGGFVLTLELPEDDRFFDDKADILELAGLNPASSFKLLPNQEPAPELFAFLRLLNLSGADAFLLEALFRNDAWGHVMKPVSEQNERSVYVSMIEGCREALLAYATTIDEDLALLPTVEPGSRKEMAIKVRLGEKDGLDSVLRFLEARIGQLARLEYYQERRLKSLGLLDDKGDSTYDSFFKDGVA